MGEESKPGDQFGEQADAAMGGGASADRGNRDTGLPGPAPGSGLTGGAEAADPTDTGRTPEDRPSGAGGPPDKKG